MSCRDEQAPCRPGAPGLGLVSPPPGLRRLRRRMGEFSAFAHDITATVERDGALGRDWDVEGDPLASELVALWAYVAEIVAAYTELTAGEAYLGTCADWTDLRRLADLIGFRPRPCVAAQGWIRAEVDKGAEPLLPAGTRVQAPAAPPRKAQTYEVAEDTKLRSDWEGLTATWVPVARKVQGRTVRFLGDPGLRVGDRVLFVSESFASGPCVVPNWEYAWSADFWIEFWRYVLCLFGIVPTATPLAVAAVVGRLEELGTTVVQFDRELGGLLSSETESYAAYRILATASEARRLDNVVTLTGGTPAAPSITSLYGSVTAVTPSSIVLDAALEDLSAGQTVAVVGWGIGGCDVVTVDAHTPVSWDVAPGTHVRASRLDFADAVPTLQNTQSDLTVYVVDRRIVARHYDFPKAAEGVTGAQLRLYPAPDADHDPAHVAVETTGAGGKPSWEVLACRRALAQEPQDDSGAPRGLIVDLLDGPPKGTLAQARASANLARIRHGTTASAALGSGDAARAGQRFTLPDAPIAYDVDDAGALVPTLDLRVDGVHWDEVPSLYGQGPAQAFATRLEVDGGITARFGDGVQGARIPTGRNNVASRYRVGGGTAGEVESSAIDSLVGSVRGVKKVRGVGTVAGGADRDDERRLRALVPARARGFGRAVAIEDLADLSLAFPGVTHAAAWNGTGPPGCACGRSGLHLAFLRAGVDGPRSPQPAEIAMLAGYLDARRDATVPLCVCAALPTTPPLQLTVQLATDPRRRFADVAAAVQAALLDPDGPLAPLERALGEPLDRSDVVTVIHTVAGVAGVPSLTLPGAAGELGRRFCERYELIVLDPAPVIGGGPA